MEYVGRRVVKRFQGHDIFSAGSVQSYDPATGLFRIVYEEDDVSEELELLDLHSLLDFSATEQQPQKRRRIDNHNQGNSTDNSVNQSEISVNLVDKGGGGEFDLNLNGDDYDIKENHGVGLGDGAKHELDLNEVHLEMDLDKEMIDLNMSGNEDYEKLSDERNDNRGFDLNLELTDVEIRYLDDSERICGDSEGVSAGGDVQMMEELDKEILVNVGVDQEYGLSNTEEKEEKQEYRLSNMEEKEENKGCGLSNMEEKEENKGCGLSNMEEKEDNQGYGISNTEEKEEKQEYGISNTEEKEEKQENGLSNMEEKEENQRCGLSNMEEKEENLPKNCVSEVDNENVTPVSVVKKRRGRKRKEILNNKAEVATPETVKLDVEAGDMTVNESIDDASGISYRGSVGRDSRKRKDLSDNGMTLPTPVTGLRRSSRRAKMAALEAQDNVFIAAEMDEVNLQSCSLAFMSEEKIMVSDLGKSSESITHAPKVVLPPSSSNLDLAGVSAFDFVSIYAFLRSFSTLLLLSPFELDEFVASVKSNESNLLIDSIHVSLLRALRKQLLFLSDEGSVSASQCLRSFNWDFLDLITWPMFVVEYLLLHSSGRIHGSEHFRWKMFQSGYYKLPVSAKVDILRHLCDDVIEVEAFRLELNRRTLAKERHIILEQNMKFDSSKKRKGVRDAVSSSCITEEDVDESADWNSDECCLCKMDGNLICCDGCPAAFHSRCVGVVSSLLPEGDWYCPECVIEKDRPWMKVGKSIRGAELLGIDPYGRLFYSSCGYLLVLESCNGEYSCWSYNRNDLHNLIEALESSPVLYDTIVSAICKQWNIVRGVGGTRNNMDTQSYSKKSDFTANKKLTVMDSAPSETHNKDEAFGEKNYHEKSSMTANSSNVEFEFSKHVTVMLETGKDAMKMENQVACPEELAILSQAPMADNLKENELEFSKTSPVKCYETKYVNCYEFARTASAVYDELACQSSGKISEQAPKSVEQIIAGQLKVVLNRFTEFSWSNVQNSNANYKKEKCGWCFYCKHHVEEMDCILIMKNSVPAIENFTCEALDIQLRKNRESHLVDVICHMICIENHLQGLLLGPWMNSHYSMLWRKSVAGAADITLLKILLLKLESNLHHLAFSTDWQKHTDYVSTMGSASHIVSSSARASSKSVIGRKITKSTELGISPSSNAATGLSLYWWRGGRISRKLFNWKVLPHTLASRAARQGGCKKIPDILYPESGEFAKRTKCAAWRAAVETSKSVEQIALQIRELDANIRWDDIENTNLFLTANKESLKSLRSFRKATIRRKCSEGTTVKYLLDFGKRRFIPDVVVKHGSTIEEASVKKKRYWLEESHVPLHLLKAFEEKMISRKSNKMNSRKLCEINGLMRKPFKKKGFSYLFSKAERPESYQCGHCNKDLLIREAETCQFCKGFFHTRHLQKSAESITGECLYTCHKCKSGKLVKVYGRRRKSKVSKIKEASKRLNLLRSRKGKKLGKEKQVVNIVPLRRSTRNAERNVQLSLPKTKLKKRKKRKQVSEGKKLGRPRKTSWKKKRTPVNSSSYWLNGLRLSRRPNDERFAHFRSKMLVLSGEVTSVVDKPKCSLCGELEYASQLNYVSCETCGVWFHGDALDLRDDRIEKLVGFKCHNCLSKTPPTCPHYNPAGGHKAEPVSENGKRKRRPVQRFLP